MRRIKTDRIQNTAALCNDAAPGRGRGGILTWGEICCN